MNNELDCPDCGRTFFNEGLVRRGKVQKCEDCWAKETPTTPTMNWIDEKEILFDFWHAYTFAKSTGGNCDEVIEKHAQKLTTALTEARTNGYNAGLADGTDKPLLAIEVIRTEAKAQGAQEALAKVEKLEKIIMLYGEPRCNNLHHKKAHRHEFDEECPVVAEILHYLQQLKDNKEQ